MGVCVCVCIVMLQPVSPPDMATEVTNSISDVVRESVVRCDVTTSRDRLCHYDGLSDSAVVKMSCRLYCCLDVHDYYDDLCLINSVIRLLFRTRAMASLRSAARRCGMKKLLMNVSSSCWRYIGTLNRPLLKSYKMIMVR